jgi:hypothetical protein
MQLRSRGFLVETVGPDFVSDVPADVEVRLEECSPEDVLNKAAVGKESDDLWVFVAPGALDERARPMRTISLMPPVVDEFVSTPILHSATMPQFAAMSNIAAPLPHPQDDLILSDLAMRAVQMPVEVPRNNGNGAKSEKAVSSREVLLPPLSTTAADSAALQGVPHRTPAAPAAVGVPRAKVPASPKRAEIAEIPRVPPRPETKFVVPIQPLKVMRSRSYKIAFRVVPGFWRTTSAALALLVLAGLLTAVMIVRPIFSTKSRPAGVPAQPALAIPAPPAQSQSTPTIEKPAVPVRSAPPSTSPSVAQSSSAETSVPSQQSPRRRSASDDGIIAEDTVVFYERPGMKPQPKKPSHLESKRYSDLN